jgi:hypothetical protein
MASGLRQQNRAVGPWWAYQIYQFLARRLGKLAAELPEEESGKELGQVRGLELRIEHGKERCMLHGKEPDKELTLLSVK